jgi:hypothetical protein
MGRKRMYKNFPRSLDEKLVDKEQSYRWLKFRGIKEETESRTVAAQDQALCANCYKKLKINIDSVKNAKKLQTTSHKDVPFWQRMNTP